MKHHLLLGTALLAAFSAFAQTGRVRHQASGLTDIRKQKVEAYHVSAIEAQPTSPLIGSGTIYNNSADKSSAAPTAVSWKLLCGSMNVYGMVINTTRPLQYHPYLNAVTFVHRKSDTYTTNPVLPLGAQSGVVVAEVSTN